MGIARCSEAGEPDYQTCAARWESLDLCAQREHALRTERLHHMCRQRSRRQRDEPLVGDAHGASSLAVEDKAERQIRVAHIPSETPDLSRRFRSIRGSDPARSGGPLCAPRRSCGRRTQPRRPDVIDRRQNLLLAAEKGSLDQAPRQPSANDCRRQSH